MKKVITVIITLIFLIILTFITAFYTKNKFIDLSFFVGLAITVCVMFFSSKGGITTRRLNMKNKRSRINVEEQKFEFYPNYIFFTSVLYTILSLIITLLYYRNYF